MTPGDTTAPDPASQPALHGRTWSHKLALPLVRLLAKTPATPNHVTGLRLLVGIGACAFFAVGDRSWTVWGGWLWVLSAFLDRVDGELARLGGKTSSRGHRFDMVSDTLVNSAFFVGAGIGLRGEEWLGPWFVALGLAAGLGVFLAQLLAEVIDQAGKETGDTAYPGFAGFDFDDILYLLAVVAWMDWLMPLVLAASVGAPAFALLTWTRLRAVRRRQAATWGEEL